MFEPMSNRRQVYNYSAILRERVEGLLALFGELQTLRRRLRAALQDGLAVVGAPGRPPAEGEFFGGRSHRPMRRCEVASRPFTACPRKTEALEQQFTAL